MSNEKLYISRIHYLQMWLLFIVFLLLLFLFFSSTTNKNNGLLTVRKLMQSKGESGVNMKHHHFNKKYLLHTRTNPVFFSDLLTLNVSLVCLLGLSFVFPQCFTPEVKWVGEKKGGGDEGTVLNWTQNNFYGIDRERASSCLRALSFSIWRSVADQWEV